MESTIIFEDKDLMVLDKPAGWIVNEAETTGATPVIQDWLKKNFKYEIVESREYRSGIVHRLDKETSGVLLVAKTQGVFEELQRQFKERIVKKTYVALLHGNVKPTEGEIKTEVGRLPWRRDRFGLLPGGRESQTKYKVLSYYTLLKTKLPHLKAYTLVEFYPKTGRTHQIRIHAKYIGHPIVGDEFYAGRKTSRADRGWCPRLFLHASGISFVNPQNGERIEFNSDLSIDLQSSLEMLQKVKYLTISKAL